MLLTQQQNHRDIHICVILDPLQKAEIVLLLGPVNTGNKNPTFLFEMLKAAQKDK
jgi:hypothetical protein